MKIALVCVFIAMFGSVKTRSSDFAIDPKTETKNVNKAHTFSRGKTEISHAIEQSEPISSKVKNRLLPKIEIKDTSEENNNSPSISTTRRPLMSHKKFTSKPHAVHYIHSLTHGEQSNFSKRRNLNANKRYNTQNKNKHTTNISKEPESVEERFKNFTDVGGIDELGQNKRKVNTNRQLSRRRGYPLATAASEQFKSVTLNAKIKMKSKSKLAIQESLQKIRRIRPGMKENPITTTDTIPIEIKNGTETYTTTMKDIERNTPNALEKSVLLVQSPDKSIYPAKITKKMVNSTTTNRNLEIENFGMNTEKADLSENTIDKLIGHRNKTEIVNSTTTKTNNIVINTEKTIPFITTTEKLHGSLITDNPVHPTDKIETSEIDNSVPFIIVTGKSLSLSDRNDTSKAITNDNIILEEKVDPNKFTVKKVENLITVTPSTNDDEVTTPEVAAQHLVERRKRSINIIEEERAATTSTSFRFTGRGIPLSINFSFRNIHT